MLSLGLPLEHWSHCLVVMFYCHICYALALLRGINDDDDDDDDDKTALLLLSVHSGAVVSLPEIFIKYFWYTLHLSVLFVCNTTVGSVCVGFV